jgi:hypothetical protein
MKIIELIEKNKSLISGSAYSKAHTFIDDKKITEEEVPNNIKEFVIDFASSKKLTVEIFQQFHENLKAIKDKEEKSALHDAIVGLMNAIVIFRYKEKYQENIEKLASQIDDQLKKGQELHFEAPASFEDYSDLFNLYLLTKGEPLETKGSYWAFFPGITDI